MQSALLLMNCLKYQEHWQINQTLSFGSGLVNSLPQRPECMIKHSPPSAGRSSSHVTRFQHPGHVTTRHRSSHQLMKAIGWSPKASAFHFLLWVTFSSVLKCQHHSSLNSLYVSNMSLIRRSSRDLENGRRSTAKLQRSRTNYTSPSIANITAYFHPVWHWNAPWEVRERKGSFSGHNWLLWTNGLRGSSENWSFTKMCVLTWTSFYSYSCLATGKRKCVSSWRMRARRLSTTSGRDKNRSSSAFWRNCSAPRLKIPPSRMWNRKKRTLYKVSGLSTCLIAIWRRTKLRYSSAGWTSQWSLPHCLSMSMLSALNWHADFSAHIPNRQKPYDRTV